MKNYKALLKAVSTFIFDFDGVLTDGRIWMLGDGEALRCGNVKDGYAMQLAVKKNYRVAVISGGKSLSMERRFEALNVKDVFLGVDNKIKVYHDYLLKNNLLPENILYMGDDIPDLEIMLEAGVPTCPADAAEEIKAVSKYISGFKGGDGCARDVIEQVMKIQENWMNDGAFHW